jgi:hypothetical protein
VFDLPGWNVDRLIAFSSNLLERARMPQYVFEVNGDTDLDEIKLPNDQAAWAELVTLCGEMLKDADGRFSSHADLTIVAKEGGRRVAEIRVSASKPDTRL